MRYAFDRHANRRASSTRYTTISPDCWPTTTLRWWSTWCASQRIRDFEIDSAMRPAREATRFTWERTAHDTLAVLAADLVRRRGH